MIGAILDFIFGKGRIRRAVFYEGEDIWLGPGPKPPSCEPWEAHEWIWIKSDSGHDMRKCSICGCGNGNDFWDELNAADGDEDALVRLKTRPGLPETWEIA